MQVTEDFVRVVQFAGGRDNRICRRCDANKIISELERKLTLPQVLFVLPTGHIGKGSQARKPLGDFIDRVAVFFEGLITGSPADEL